MLATKKRKVSNDAPIFTSRTGEKIKEVSNFSKSSVNTDGKIIYVADRIDEADGTKKVLPRSFVKDETSGQQGWITKKLLKIISCISKKHLRIKKVCLF